MLICVEFEIFLQLLYDDDYYSFRVLAEYIMLLYRAYVDLYFTYLEINPLGESSFFSK